MGRKKFFRPTGSMYKPKPDFGLYIDPVGRKKFFRPTGFPAPPDLYNRPGGGVRAERPPKRPPQDLVKRSSPQPGSLVQLSGPSKFPRTLIQVCDPNHDPVCKCIRWAVVHDPQHTPIPVCDPICDLVCKCIHCRCSGSPSPPDSTSMTPTKT